MNAKNYLPSSTGRLYVAMLCLMPVIAMLVPRFTGPGTPLIAVFGLGAFYYAHRRLPEFSRYTFLWALAFPALMALSALWGVAPETSFMRAVKTLPIVLSAPILWEMARTLDEKTMSYFYRLFPRTVIVAGCICALELYNAGPLYHFVHAIQQSTEKDFNLSPINRSVVVFTLSTFIALFCLRHSDYPSRKKNILLAALAIVTGLVLYATTSQSAQLAFILGAIFYVAFPYAQKGAWLALAGILAVLLVATPWLAQFMFHHIAAHAGDYSWLGKSYANQRLEIWDFVSRRALERPLLGHGAEAARTIKDFDSAKLYWPTTKVLHPHNFSVQLWIEFGILGALVGAAFFADLLRHIQKLSIHHARTLLPLFVASLSVATTGYGIWQSWWLGMFCLLFGYAALVIRKPAR
jgi:O-antigen ligase